MSVLSKKKKKNGERIVLSHIARLILKLLKFLMHLFNQSVYRSIWQQYNLSEKNELTNF